jgi:ADP-ribose pyrophosphatase YjhB (NUDIX family)
MVMETSGCRVHKLVADVCLASNDGVLLVRYKNTSAYDGETGWFLPDDFLRHTEHPDEAARRILKDQAGIDGVRPELSHIESFEGHGYWHLVFHYSAQLTGSERGSPGGNVGALEWFPLDRLPPADEVGHGGWALETLQAVRSGASTSSGEG